MIFASVKVPCLGISVSAEKAAHTMVMLCIGAAELGKALMLAANSPATHVKIITAESLSKDISPHS